MRRWGGLIPRRRDVRASAGPRRQRADASATAPGAAVGKETEALLVEDHDGLLLLRTASDTTLTASDVADLSRGMRTGDGTVTVIVGADGVEPVDVWSRLSELLDSLDESGTDTVRLVMAGAGDDTKERPSAARRIADAWSMSVSAPDGAPLFVPGGSLFVPPPPGRTPSAGGWWQFAPGAAPRALGPRSPEPSWQSALPGVPTAVTGGSVVEQIPAGLLIRPAEAPRTEPGDLYHAVPVDPRRLAVVIGVPSGEDVSVEEVTEVLTALPAKIRSGVRLLPGGRRDVLPTAQSVADRLRIGVEVMTGLPLIAAAGVAGAYSIRSVVTAPDGTPQWMPFVDAVLCRPPDEGGRAQPPRLLRWAPPLPGPARAEQGVIGLSDRWQVTVTRAGLWVGSRGGPQLSPTARRVEAGGPVIELGTQGEAMDSSLWPALANLLSALAPGLRTRATLLVHGVPMDGGGELRRLASQHGVRTLRYDRPARPAVGAGRNAGARPAQVSAPGRPTPTPKPAPGVQAKTARPDGLSARPVPPSTVVAPSPEPVESPESGPPRPARPGPDGAPSVFDWSDDAVPLGSLERARRLRPTREQAHGTSAQANGPAPAEQEPAERPDEEHTTRTAPSQSR
ncbi:hypothetical protein [Streptomyces sp. NPDC006645]|uniref:hypothetical protein n=1 Tax=unclassified Streptomyces TaxID=2593676 RepID=UPI0033B1E083